MRRHQLLLLVASLTLTLLLSGGDASARSRGNGPGKPVFPPRGATDTMLHAKAAKLQALQAAHISPEGLFVTTHRRGATPAQLSHDALENFDSAIWTGCYAGSQAVRYGLTRSPDALQQVRRLAKGLALLSSVTGTPGRLCRTVGRAIPGETISEDHKKVLTPVPGQPGLLMCSDVSRDQLAGVVLGWSLIARYVDDPALRAQAKQSAVAIARQLRADGMWLRDHTGRKTKYGELRETVEHLPMLKNGPFAAIGLAPFCLAAMLEPTPEIIEWRESLIRKGWRSALSSQMTWFNHLITNSNANMACVALLSIRLCLDTKEAREGLGALRKATTGWWNGGICACFLLGAGLGRRDLALAELRASLHLMNPSERPPAEVRLSQVRGLTTIGQRGVRDWHWKSNIHRLRPPVRGRGMHPTITYTRGDFLFAYWLARASRALPARGAGR